MSEPSKNSTLLSDALRAEIKGLMREVLLEERVARDDHAPWGDDHLLDAGEAAKLLGYSKYWLYRHWRKLPFSRKLGSGLRFSHNGIQKWLAGKKSS